MTSRRCTEHIAEHLASHGARIDLFVYCPYHPRRGGRGVRPHQRGPQAAAGHGQGRAAALNLDLTASWVVGDRPEDMGLAEAIGASAVYLGTDDHLRPGVWPFPSLAAAAPFILERITSYRNRSLYEFAYDCRLRRAVGGL